MIEKSVRIGFDRFLALEWADYALELFLSSQNDKQNYELLKQFVENRIQGKDSARKTANQLKRLWLNSEDGCQELRESAKDLLQTNPGFDYKIFHFGLALNVFPIFLSTSRKIGEIVAIQNQFTRNQVTERVSKDFLNPNSIPRIVSRVIQTLENWGFVESLNFYLKPKKILIADSSLSTWFIQSLLFAMKREEISLVGLVNTPIKIGVEISDIRKIITQTDKLAFRKNSPAGEIICLLKS